VRKLARLAYDGRHQVGEVLARALIETANISVGGHNSEAYQLQVRHTCADMELLRDRVKQPDQHIEGKLQEREVGKLLTTIDGVGARTAACLIAELGDPSRFRDAAALASYVGVVPRPGNRASARSAAPAAFRSEMRACVIVCGCRPCSPSGNTLGCARITTGSWLWANGRRSHWSPACESC
jgi:transposase